MTNEVVNIPILSLEKDSKEVYVGVRTAGETLIGRTFKFTGTLLDDANKIYALKASGGNWPLNTFTNSVVSDGRTILDVLKSDGGKNLTGLTVKVLAQRIEPSPNGSQKYTVDSYNGYYNDDMLPKKVNAKGYTVGDYSFLDAMSKEDSNAWWNKFYATNLTDNVSKHRKCYLYEVEFVSITTADE